MFIRLLLIGGSFFAGVLSFFWNSPPAAQQNNAPQVHIHSPASSGQYAWNTVIPYAICVFDKEDGESRYGEIANMEIFLELRYFPDPAKAVSFMHGTTQKEQTGYSLIKKQDCFNCHSVHTKLIGPSFSDISNKYKKLSDITPIAGHVINGSSGRWGAAMMPTHPGLSKKDAEVIVQWIIENTSDPDVDYLRGAEGSFRMQPSPNATANGVLVLKATYTDHGIGDAPASSLTGQDMVSFGIKKN